MTETTGMSNYIPLQIKTHYSLLHGFCKSEKLAEKLVEYKIPACAITDYGTISGCVNFYQKMKEKGIKPILGCTLYICEGESTDHSQENKRLSYLTLLCKTKSAWHELIKIVSFSNDPARWDGKPRLSLQDLAQFNLKDFVCITGGVGSVPANVIWKDRKLAYNCDQKTCREQVLDDWLSKATDKINYLKVLFGANFFLEASTDDIATLPAQQILLECWSEFTDVKLVASPNTHYLNQDDAIDHRILLCSYTGKELKDIPKVIADYDEYTLGSFFLSDKYYLKSYLSEAYTVEEIQNSILIGELCEPYDILSKPTLPSFPCPEGKTETEVLRELCREGWKKKSARIKKEEYQKYGDRVKLELSVIEEKDFPGYFLIVRDIIQWCANQGYLTGSARGSVGGCLIAYLAGITVIDSIKHNLLFERFIAPGRKGLPDIDFDVPMHAKEKVLDYIKRLYGNENVYQMITYQNLKGRSALREVLRAYGTPYELCNRMTDPIPDEAKIADDLQEMKEEDGESSIIRWALENRTKDLEEWCQLDEQGELQGPYSKRFEQAIRLENTKKAQSKHACGVVISPVKFIERCPLIYDKANDLLVGGLEMKDMEAVGLVKMDVLGLSTLDRIMKVKETLKDGIPVSVL